MPPLTDGQRRLVEEYAAQWPNPVAVVRGLWPPLWRAAVACGLEAADVAGAAWEGVARAATDYDPGREASFATYAHWWIRGKVSHLVTGARVQKRFAHGRPRSGDAPVRGDRKETPLWDVLGVSDPARPQDDPAEFDRLAELRRQVADALRFLGPRHRRIIELRFGLGGGPCHTLEEVGDILGVTRERVRQLEARALARIAAPLQVKCFDHMKFGRGDQVRESLNGSPAAEAANANGSCGQCGKPFGRQKRCYTCNPRQPGGGRRPGRRAPKAAPALPDLGRVLAAVGAVEAALAGFDRPTAQHILDFVAGRAGAQT
jgi:RNA polymerase sigma factor (sigma-70 family)